LLRVINVSGLITLQLPEQHRTNQVTVAKVPEKNMQYNAITVFAY